MRPPFLALLALSLVGCEGEVLGGAPNVGAPGSTLLSNGMPPSTPATRQRTFTCDASRPRGLAHGALRRLTSQELRNTVAALVGPDVFADTTLQQKLGGLPLDSFDGPGQLVDATPAVWAQSLFEIAKRAAEVGLASDVWRAQNLGACVNTTQLDDACVQTALSTFGARVWRRELTAAEVSSLMDGYRAVGAEKGLALAVRRLLQSPALSFHLEDGTSTGDGRIRLSASAVASRLSYLTTDGMPDDALLAAAREGRLETVADARREADRLLATDAGVAKVRDFFRYYMKLAAVSDPAASVAKARGIDPTGLGSELQGAALAFAMGVFEDGDFTALMQRDVPIGSARVQELLAAGPHPGLVHQPALLASTGDRTSPIHRGAQLRKQLLCDQLGAPDPALIAARQAQVGDLSGLSNRDKVTQLTSPAICQGCHARVNPLGFTFEGYDSLGMQRDAEVLYDADGKELQRWPLNTAVQPLALEVGGADTVPDSVALAAELAQSFKARGCFAQRSFEYFRLAAIDYGLDGCALSEAETQAHDGTLRDVLLSTLANEDLFYRPEPTP